MKIRYNYAGPFPLFIDVEQIVSFKTREESMCRTTDEKYEVVSILLKNGRTLESSMNNLANEIRACQRLIEALKTPLRMAVWNVMFKGSFSFSTLPPGEHIV